MRVSNEKRLLVWRQQGKAFFWRGDTDFSQTEHLDGWDGGGIGFVFGSDARPHRVEKAKGLAEAAWQRLERPAAYEVKTQQRSRPLAVKEEVVRQKGYTNIRLLSEDVAEFAYRPVACPKAYRVVGLRKNLVVEKGGVKVEDQARYFSSITNERDWSAADVVSFANDRCNQEDLVEQLKNGVKALRLPSNTLEANGAYRVSGALAWSSKAWVALWQPRREHRDALLSMEFKQFLQEWLSLACQVARSGRQMMYRAVQDNEWVPVRWRTAGRLRQLRLT
jgi:hypothetical protein